MGSRAGGSVSCERGKEIVVVNRRHALRALRIDPKASGSRPYTIPADNPFATSSQVVAAAFAIADASGHGLPAALQVRDVYTGLRMAVERDFKIVRTVERLNRIIHQSRMTTKFVSLFYGEIEEEGNFIYVNAGHPPPLHFHARGVTTLKQTGMVLGPSATASYSRGFLALEPGDSLLLYTDGMTEASDPKGREFGIERLKKAFLAIKEKPADEIVLGHRRIGENRPKMLLVAEALVPGLQRVAKLHAVKLGREQVEEAGREEQARGVDFLGGAALCGRPCGRTVSSTQGRPRRAAPYRF